MIEQGTGPWRLRLICCGREDGLVRFETSEEADAFRESYMSGVAVAWHGYSSAAHEPGHRRAAIKEWAGLDPENKP